ncbi:MAG: asparaginase, partial [Lachnospiraceae bacterium]|nr:asparaginase [Candidatus Minthocola equi]
MKKILVIGTGGTIASKPTQNGLAPALSAGDLLEAIPYAASICEVECVQAFSLDSTNIRPGHWLIIAGIIKENYDKYDGFVIAHGTDTLAYTAAGLSYLITNSAKPIVLTGAQKPMMEDVTDAKQNLIDALTYAADDDSHNVCVVFNGNVIAGTRARKNYSKNFAAFASINFPFLAQIQDHRIIRYFPDTTHGDTNFYSYINPNVGLIKLTPGMNNHLMHYALDCYDGVVIESFGVGGLPEYSDYFQQVKEAGEQGKLIVMTTQVPNEGSDLSVYKVGAVVKDTLKILEAHDMTSEAALAKLMWVLGQTNDFEQAGKLFYTQVHHDILC